MTIVSTADALLYNTLRLETHRDGRLLSTGTGFLVVAEVGPNTHVQILVTNKHVLEGGDMLAVHFHLSKSLDDPAPSGASQRYEIAFVPDNVISHPADDVDLCCLNLTAIIMGARERGMPFLTSALKTNTIPTGDQWRDFDGIEAVTMIGCPNGLYDRLNNLALSRRGITATPLYNNYEGRREFAVDMACYPGSSGSPIFVFDRDGYRDKRRNTYLMRQSRLHLVGVLFAGPMIDNVGNILLQRPPEVHVATPMHLGYAVKSDRILELIDLLKGLIADRAEPPAP